MRKLRLVNPDSANFSAYFSELSCIKSTLKCHMQTISGTASGSLRIVHKVNKLDEEDIICHHLSGNQMFHLVLNELVNTSELFLLQVQDKKSIRFDCVRGHLESELKISFGVRMKKNKLFLVNL